MEFLKIIGLSIGSIFKENLKKAKIDLNEFLVQCRTNGFFNLSDIKTDNIFFATYNSDGNLSVYLTNNEKNK